jgi:purine nucleosidase
MKPSLVCLLAACLATLSIHICAASQGASATPAVPPARAIPRVIVDTDIWPDIDDALALAMIHALDARGEIKLLAVTVSTRSHWSASYVDLVDAFYGSDVPIGLIQHGRDTSYLLSERPTPERNFSSYTKEISERKNADGAWTYPRRLHGGNAVDATSLLRKTLAAQPDGSTVLIQLGGSANVARLLASPPDSISSMDGRSLAARKIRLLSIMAGSFREVTYQGRTIPKGSPEYNLMIDVPAAQQVFSNWPTPIVATGMELGVSIPYPPESIEQDFGYVRDHPIAETYRSYCAERLTRAGWTCPHSHPTSDLPAVLYAARPDRNYFSLSNPGTITVLKNGGTRFDETPEGKHRYLILSDAQQGRVLESMVMLASQPPAKTFGTDSSSGVCPGSERCDPVSVQQAGHR